MPEREDRELMPRPQGAQDQLPSTLNAVWRSMRLAYRAEPRLLVVSFVLSTLASVPDALGALWLKFLADGVTKENGRLIGIAAGGLAASAAAGWLLRVGGGRINNLFSQRATIAIEAHVAKLQASVPSLEHHERPEYLDRLQILKDYVFLLNHLYGSLFGMIGSVVRLVLTILLLVSVHPALALLALFALPTVVVSSKRAGVERQTEESVAQYKRRARHLFELGTFAGPAKEIRVTRLGPELVQRRRATWDQWFAAVSRTRKASALWHSAAWALFGAAYMAAIVLLTEVRHASAGDVLLALAAGGRLSQYIAMTVGNADFLKWTIDASKGLGWLEDYAASHGDRADTDAPARLERGLRLEDVSFAYPGTDHEVLQDVTLDLPAGSVVAVVGENGAGKTTLVKLLCRFYEPSEGRITVDGVDLSRIAADQWRSRLGGAFQDFFRFELFAQGTVGVGDLIRADEVPAVTTAVSRGGATDVIERLPSGLETQLGPTWNNGVELSFGQWQKLSLARGLMRDHPLLVVLDEPTAALDAETEHALFERFAAASREANEDGRITVLVSHRFSTVRMADIIVVLDGSRVVEHGSHEDLIARNGLYAELYGMQAQAYR